MGKGVSKAVDHLNKEIAPALLVSVGMGCRQACFLVAGGSSNAQRT
jgi:hypothetical protein